MTASRPATRAGRTSACSTSSPGRGVSRPAWRAGRRGGTGVRRAHDRRRRAGRASAANLGLRWLPAVVRTRSCADAHLRAAPRGRPHLPARRRRRSRDPHQAHADAGPMWTASSSFIMRCPTLVGKGARCLAAQHGWCSIRVFASWRASVAPPRMRESSRSCAAHDRRHPPGRGARALRGAAGAGHLRRRYWDLEQTKLKRSSRPPPFAGEVA